MKLFKNKLAIILILGIVIRIVIFLWANQYLQNGDLNRYIDWGKISYLYGFEKTYHKEFINFGISPNNQPPGSLYLSALNFNIYIHSSSIIHKAFHQKPGSLTELNISLANFIFRIPSFIAELLITLLIYYLLRKNKGSFPNLAAGLYFLNPITIYNSAIWGQMDAINNLFFFLAITLLTQKKFFLSMFSYAISLFTKLSLLPLLPLYLLNYLKLESKKYLIFLYALIIGAVIFLFTLPISSNPIMWILQFVNLASGGEIQSITSGAFNFWYGIYRLAGSTMPLETARLFGFPLLLYGYLIYFLLLIPLLLKKINTDTTFKIFLFMSIAALIAFLFLPKMHERYLYPFFPLFAVVVGFDKKYLKYMLIISGIHFANLFLIWNPAVVPILPYALIYNPIFEACLSFSLIIISGGLYKKALHE